MFSVPAVRQEFVPTTEEPVPDMYTRTGLADIRKTGSLSFAMAFNRTEACFHAVVATCHDSFSTVSFNSAASFVLPAVKYTNSRPAVDASNYPGLILSAVFFVDFPDRLCLILPISVVRAVVRAVVMRPLSCEIDYLGFFNFICGPVLSSLV